MDKYEKANKQAAYNKQMTAVTSVPLALTNPEAARIRNAGYEASDNEPVTSITGGQKSASDQQGLDKGASSQAMTDDETDPDSNVSGLARQEFKRITGLDAPARSTAADIKRTLPETKIATDRDTKVYQTDTVANTAEKGRVSK